MAALGASAALGNDCPACRRAAGVIRHRLGRHGGLKPLSLRWQAPIVAPESGDAVADLAALCERIAARTAQISGAGRPFVFTSGDHSQAMGVWRGVIAGLPPARRLGLLWIDAHLDAHTTHTSPSQNVHGMPVAGLLGADDPLLRRLCGDEPLLQADQICLVGAHSFEVEERRWLERLGVRCFGMRAVRRRGLDTVMRQAWQWLAYRCDRIGISLDLDAVDPVDAPGVAVPAGGGLRASELLTALARLPRPVGLEIAEYNPVADQRLKTLDLIAAVIRSVYGDKSRPYRSFGSGGRAIRSTS